MTAPTERKRAERQRRKEAGERRVEVWLSNDAAVALADMETVTNYTAASLIEAAVLDLHAATIGGSR